MKDLKFCKMNDVNIIKVMLIKNIYCLYKIKINDFYVYFFIICV